MQSITRTTKTAFALDFSNFERGFALRCSIGVAIPLVVALALDKPQLGVSAALGALSTGFASQQGVYRTRAAAMLATAGGMSLSMLVGGYAAHASVAMIVVAAVWGYAYGVVSSLGPTATAVGLNSVVALVIADAFSGSSISGVPLQAALVLAGGLEQTLLLVVLWPARRYSSERHALGDAYRALGHFAAEMGSSPVAAPHPRIIAGVRETLSDPAPFARRGDIAAFQALADEAERMRGSLGALVTDRYRYERRSESARSELLRAFAAATAPLLEELANALHEARAPHPPETAWRAAEQAACALDALPGAIGKHARSQAQALLGQLRSAARIASAPAPGVAAPLPKRQLHVPPVAQTLVALRASLSLRSPYGRHALRLGVALAISMLLARLGPFHRGYWIPMTAALVLRPDFGTTFARGVARVAGTLLGAIVATIVVASVRQSMTVDVALAILFAAAGYFVFSLNYAAYTVTVTAYVVFLLAVSGNVTEHDAVIQRGVATLAGALVAAFVYLAWPTWESERARKALASQLRAYRAYAAQTLQAYVDPAPVDRRRLRELQRAAWQTRTSAETSVDTMIAEPQHTHAIAPRVALGVLAAMQRIGVALLALNGFLDTATRAAQPELSELAGGIDLAFAYCIARLDRASGERRPALRELYLDAERRLSGRADSDAGVVLAGCDLIVDGLNTVADLLASPAPR